MDESGDLGYKRGSRFFVIAVIKLSNQRDEADPIALGVPRLRLLYPTQWRRGYNRTYPLYNKYTNNILFCQVKIMLTKHIRKEVMIMAKTVIEIPDERLHELEAYKLIFRLFCT